MAGHSKFANIKHRKEKNDSIRGRVFTRLGREIQMAVKHGGGPNLDGNSRLRDAVSKAKVANMSNETIERCIKKAAGDIDQVNFTEAVYEGYGPGGTAVMVKVLTDNKNRTAANVRHAFTKGNGNLGTPGCVSFMFKETGHILVESEGSPDENVLMEIAIEAGATDFVVIDGGYEIFTEPETFSEVREALESNNVIIADGSVAMIPHTYTSLSGDDIKLMSKMLDLLDNDDDVQSVYHNLDEDTLMTLS